MEKWNSNVVAKNLNFIDIANPMDKLITVSKKSQQIGICGCAAVNKRYDRKVEAEAMLDFHETRLDGLFQALLLYRQIDRAGR